MLDLKRSRCGACGEPIFWVATDEKKSMPIDVEPVKAGNLLLATAERPPRISVVSRTGRPRGMKLYVSHFTTCRHAHLYRQVTPGRRTAAAQPPSTAPGLFTEAQR